MNAQRKRKSRGAWILRVSRCFDAIATAVLFGTLGACIAYVLGGLTE